MDFSLNYVWIQAARIDVAEAPSPSTPTIPERLMRNIVATANTFPDQQISVWIDLFGPGFNGPDVPASLNSSNDTPNITFRSLDEIPAYMAHPVFKEPFDGYLNDAGDNNTSFWRQHDLARLYVVDHGLNETSTPVFYADMDINLAHSGTLKTAVERIEKYGAAVGLPNTYCAVDCQFFGFNAQGRSFLQEEVIRCAEETTNKELLGWEGFRTAFEKHTKRHLTNLPYPQLLNVGTSFVKDAQEIKKGYQTPTSAPAQYLHQQP